MAVAALYTSIIDPPVAMAQYRALLHGWEVLPIRDGTEIIGAVIRNGQELHVGVARSPSPGASRNAIRRALIQTIRIYGGAVTAVRRRNTRGLDFCERLGFLEVGRTEEMIYLRCQRSHHA